MEEKLKTQIVTAEKLKEFELLRTKYYRFCTRIFIKKLSHVFDASNKMNQVIDGMDTLFDYMYENLNGEDFKVDEENFLVKVSPRINHFVIKLDAIEFRFTYRDWVYKSPNLVYDKDTYEESNPSITDKLKEVSKKLQEWIFDPIS